MENLSIPKLTDIIDILFNENLCIDFLFQKNILYLLSNCEHCGGRVKKNKLRYRCTRNACRKSISIFRDSFFKNARISCSQIMHLAYLWLSECCHKTIIIHTGHSPNTVTDYMNFFRELVIETIETDDTIIGGDGIIIQVDETKIGKRKYHRGHRVEGAWVIVGVEKTEERGVFAEVVRDRSARTIEEVLSRHIARGSILQTDCWRGYSGIAEKLGIVHQTVNHSVGFIDHITGVETNTVEGTNFAIKRKIPIRNRTEQNIQSHLLEFVWKRKNKSKLWDSFIEALKNVLY